MSSRLTLTSTFFLAAILSTASVEAQDLGPPLPTSAGAQSKTPGVQDARELRELSTSRPEGALEEYRKLIAANPNDPILYNGLGIHLAKKGEFASAIAALKRAIEIDPHLNRLHLNLSVIYEKMGRLDEALASAIRSVSIDATDTFARSNLCGLYIDLRRFDRSSECFAVLISISPEDPVAWIGYGVTLVRAGKAELAEKILNEAAIRHPGVSQVHNSLGTAQHRNKRYIEAAQSFRRAVEIDPDKAEYRFNFGTAQLTLRNKAGAISQYNFIKSTNPALAAQLFKSIFADKLVFANGH